MATAPKSPSGHRIWLGRQREVGELEAGLDDLRAGRGSLFLITGEPGIGKTRLADEIGRAAAARGLAVHWGRAWEVGGAPSYWPFIQVLRSICGGLDPAALGGALEAGHAAEIAELIPEIRGAHPGPRGAGARSRRPGIASSSSTPWARSCGSRRRERRGCWCSTICTPPTRRRCCCSSSWCATCGRRR